MKNNGIISTFKAKLLVQEQAKQEVDYKISIASTSACVTNENVTQVYFLIMSLIAQFDKMDTDNAKVVDKKKS